VVKVLIYIFKCCSFFPVLIRHLWQLMTDFLHWCLKCITLLNKRRNYLWHFSATQVLNEKRSAAATLQFVLKPGKGHYRLTQNWRRGRVWRNQHILTTVSLLKEKVQYSWPPCTNKSRSAAFCIECIFYYFTKQISLQCRDFWPNDGSSWPHSTQHNNESIVTISLMALRAECGCANCHK
jgi:hypothetical protein